MILEKRHFALADLEKNSYKFWNIQIEDTNIVTTKYGRIGNSEATDVKNFDSASAARKYFDTKIRDKTKVRSRRDSYTEITILEGEKSTNSVTKGISRHLSDIAVEQIQTSSKEVQDLIRWFSDINIHNIISQTTISYNLEEGCFTTPLGVVDQTCINNAKDLLIKMTPFIERKDWTSKELIKFTNSYLRFLPQQLGSSSTKIGLKNIFGENGSIAKQQEIIEGLEAAISKGVKTEDRVFNAKIELVKNVNEEKIAALGSKIKNVYSLEIKPVVESWNKRGIAVGNFMKLWHGTSPANCLSIIKSGLVLSTAISGNHGKGLYFSDKHSKSLSYAASQRRNNQNFRYLFLSEVAAGNIYHGGGTSLKSGYDSLWYGKDDSESQVVVYETGRANLLFLCEISS